MNDGYGRASRWGVEEHCFLLPSRNPTFLVNEFISAYTIRVSSLWLYLLLPVSTAAIPTATHGDHPRSNLKDSFRGITSQI